MTEELRMSYPTEKQPAEDPRPVVFVLFGATGDLARRMVLPAFYRLASEGLLPQQWLLVGNGRGDVGHEDFRAHVHAALAEFGPEPEAEQWDAFAQRVLFAGAGSALTARAACPASWARPAGRWAGTRSLSITWLSRPSHLPG
jgi:hypothetical protein